MSNRKEQCTRIVRVGERGFTIMEILVSALVAGVALLVTMLVASQMGSQLHAARGRVSAQDNARVALDEVVRTLRGAGSQTDQSHGQTRFVYAGPWTIGLNANLNPIDDPDGTAEPTALDPGLENGVVPLEGADTYTPPRTFEGGAETIVLSLDSNRDGTIDANDSGDDEEEETDNPNDAVLRSFVYGVSGGANTVNSTGVALVRGPAAAADGTLPEPLFRYWIDTDNDPATEPTLHGDADADGQLSQTEIAALAPVSAGDLGLITRIDVAATAESEKAHTSNENDWSVMRSSVSFRNRSTTAVRVTGVVFHDVNENGARDSGEVGLGGVVVRSSNGFSTKTNTSGEYAFVLPPGTYTITEIDNVGYESTTPNSVSIHPAPGDYAEVNFGDLSLLGSGYIHGLVYFDKTKNGVYNSQLDYGLRGVRVFLDTGADTHTDSLGQFSFLVTVGNFTVTEVDSTGYSSSTPNVVDVNIPSRGDSVYVTFGDYKLLHPGDINGLVYQDDDNDGVHDNKEAGIANVTITLETDESTVTDASGVFHFRVEEGAHTVTEADPPNHTSSTPNVLNISVVRNQVTNVEFGDIGQQDVSYQEIRLANTQRALSISSADLAEDNKSDQDLMLGTHYVGGTNDILVWWNQRVNSGTPNSSIFNQTPTVQRVVNADVNGVATALLDANSSADLMTVMGTTSNNMAVWLTQTGKNAGLPPTAPSQYYGAGGAMSVNDVTVGKLDDNNITDMAVGSRTGTYTGRLQIWHGQGGKDFQSSGADVYTTVPIPARTLTYETLGEVVSLAKADFNRDGKDDLVVGTRRSSSLSVVYLFMSGTPSVTDTLGGALAIPVGGTTQPYYVKARLQVTGTLNDVLAVDMKEDNGNDVDILVATETSNLTGEVTLWHNRGNNHFGSGTVPDTTPNDSVDPHGAPLSMVATTADNDVFPDLVIGTRNSAIYDGQVILYRAFGFLPATGQVVSTTGVGEIVTMTAADFNKDGAPDLATGSRTSSTTGKVVVFFNQRTAI
jgi:type II secretory pathway pseudopilin PulG